MNEQLPATRLTLADSIGRMRHVFIRDLVVPCSIGVHRHERDLPQRVRINVDLSVDEGDGHADQLEQVLCYEDLANAIREIAGGPHVNLVETLADKVAEHCLLDPRVRVARIRVEKLDVFVDAVSVGVEIERINRA